MDNAIHVQGAREHNLKNIDVTIPHDRITAVTGVSGSGKSSLVFDTIFREAERRFSGAYGSLVRRGLVGFAKPDVDDVRGLRPAVAVGQFRSAGGARSTVGTITEVHDSLRVLFAKLGRWSGTGSPPEKVPSSLFSFNHPLGACAECDGTGTVVAIDPELVVGNPGKSIAEGCLVPTTPNGYIMYSQVTLAVLGDVCRAHGFDISIPWEKLTPEQQHVVLYGSDRIKVLFGKHPLENRLKWKGITAKPREEGFYGGIVPVMCEILKRERNDSIMRFARSTTCPVCHGSRLGEVARSFRVNGMGIDQVLAMGPPRLRTWAEGLDLDPASQALVGRVRQELLRRLDCLLRLGLSHLPFCREASSLSVGELQRLKIAAQLGSGLSRMLYVFDEPSAGLHARDAALMLEVLRDLRRQGNTVLFVEHDDELIAGADHVIELGPGSGKDGGAVVRAGSPVASTVRQRSCRGDRRRSPGSDRIHVREACLHNLRNVSVAFVPGALNVVTGVSGAGKSTLVRDVIGKSLRRDRDTSRAPLPDAGILEGFARFSKVITLDQEPIGRSSRSNPATYTRLFDGIRDLFAGLSEAKAAGFGKGHFSFNTAGGCCETCEGSGVEELGLHFLGTVEAPCPECGGRRFHDDVLSIKWQGRSIADVLALTVDEALGVFADVRTLRRTLETLHRVGLGYITLGQGSNTLSGGEAQRVKIASELCRPPSAATLYLLDEPTTGLHRDDVARLIDALRDLTDGGHTVIVVEHDLDLVRAADWVVDLGPGGGEDGGRLVVQGAPEEIACCGASFTGQALKRIGEASSSDATVQPGVAGAPSSVVRLEGVSTGNLKNVTVEIPHNALTVITGVSGSGKTSLAFDTLFAEGQNRFTEHLGTFARRFLGSHQGVRLDRVHGLSPTMGVGSDVHRRNPRSTVGTVTEIHDALRVLFSRAGEGDHALPISAFSFNHLEGACKVCRGLGARDTVDLEHLVTRPDRALGDGAMAGHKVGQFYGDPHGQFVAILRAVGVAKEVDFSTAWKDLSAEARHWAMEGTGPDVYEVQWSFERGSRTGQHQFKGVWKGFANLILEEYDRKRGTQRAEVFEGLVGPTVCPACQGARLAEVARNRAVAGRSLQWVLGASVQVFGQWLGSVLENAGSFDPLIAKTMGRVIPEIMRRVRVLDELGLGYLSLGRATVSLSSGETRRLALACHTVAELGGVIYVLDEPSAGLHARDVEGLLRTIRRMVDRGNTVVAVEHQLGVIAAADHVIDLGPGAGVAGGYVVACGTPHQVAACAESKTGRCLAQRPVAPRSLSTCESPTASDARLFGVLGASKNNLKNVDCLLPVGALIGICGVSGAGKTTLAFEVLAPSIRQASACGCRDVRGGDLFHRVIALDDREGGDLPDTNVGGFSGLWERAAMALARHEEFQNAGLSRHHLSFSRKEGQCPVCKGAGWIREGLGFMGDVHVPCDSCHGLRLAADIRQRAVDGIRIDEMLGWSVDAFVQHFGTDRFVRERGGLLVRLGLGGLSLSQSWSTLSTGERRRCRLAVALEASLANRSNDKGRGDLIVLDEPSHGLHACEVPELLSVLHDLVNGGHTVIVVEHDSQVLDAVDHLVRLGPGAGEDGGRIVNE